MVCGHDLGSSWPSYILMRGVKREISTLTTKISIDIERIFMQLSTKLLQDGRHEELDELMAEKEEEQRREREAAEAEFDAEEAEHMKKLNQTLDEERVDQLRAAQKDLLSKVLQ